MQALFDEYIKAFTEPSLDFIWHYIRVFCFCAVVGYAAWYLLVESRRQVVNLKVNLSDIGCDTKVGDEGSSNNEDKKNKGGSSTAKKGDTKDTTAQNSTEPTEYRSMSLKKEFN